MIHENSVLYLLQNRIGTNPKLIPKPLKGIFDNLVKGSPDLLFKVSIKDEASSSCMIEPKSSELLTTDLTYIKAKSFGKYEYNWTTNELRNSFTNKDGLSQIVTHKRTLNNVSITQETKMIGKYNCIKVIDSSNRIGQQSKFDTEVWITLGVPFPIGPAYFVGFPGMVVEVVHPGYRFILIDS